VKALQLTAPREVELVEIPVPEPCADQVLIRTGAATICTSDLIDIRSNPFGIPLPVIIGHEAAGTIVGVGTAVAGLQEGDRVAAHPVHPCGRCQACRDGTAHLCLEMGHFGINMQGVFAAYFVARADRVRAIPPEVDFTAAALAEPVCVCLEALAQAHAVPGKSLLIIGDGPFGLIMARLAAQRGLTQTVIAGRHDFRLSFAGPVRQVNTASLGSDQQDALRQLGGAAGYDAVILTVGNASAVGEALRLLKPRGRLVLFAPITGLTPIDLAPVTLKELAIVGACNDADLLDEAVALLRAGELRLEQLVTHRLPLTAYQEALALAEGGRDTAVKVAFVF
jgi:2-desacetyl-2-hydroxyethyl bacteriochlorophyllide A dehydrogenase